MRRISSTARGGILAAGAALVIAGSAVTVAGAQQAPATPTTPTASQESAAKPGAQAFLDALATRLGISSATLQQAITDARADVGAPPEGRGFPFGGRGHGGKPGRGEDLSVAASAIGISVDQLRQDLAGKSLAQVAQANGKTAADVVTALTNAANQRIDEAVAAGRLTADRAAQQKQLLAQRIDEEVNEIKGQGERGFPGREHGPGMPSPQSSVTPVPGTSN